LLFQEHLHPQCVRQVVACTHDLGFSGALCVQFCSLDSQTSPPVPNNIMPPCGSSCRGVLHSMRHLPMISVRLGCQGQAYTTYNARCPLGTPEPASTLPGPPFCF
jgi:hypothetical protein